MFDTRANTARELTFDEIDQASGGVLCAHYDANACDAINPLKHTNMSIGGGDVDNATVINPFGSYSNGEDNEVRTFRTLDSSVPFAHAHPYDSAGGEIELHFNQAIKITLKDGTIREFKAGDKATFPDVHSIWTGGPGNDGIPDNFKIGQKTGL